MAVWLVVKCKSEARRFVARADAPSLVLLVVHVVPRLVAEAYRAELAGLEAAQFYLVDCVPEHLLPGPAERTDWYSSNCDWRERLTAFVVYLLGRKWSCREIYSACRCRVLFFFLLEVTRQQAGKLLEDVSNWLQLEFKSLLYYERHPILYTCREDGR